MLFALQKIAAKVSIKVVAFLSKYTIFLSVADSMKLYGNYFSLKIKNGSINHQYGLKVHSVSDEGQSRKALRTQLKHFFTETLHL